MKRGLLPKTDKVSLQTFLFFRPYMSSPSVIASASEAIRKKYVIASNFVACQSIPLYTFAIPYKNFAFLCLLSAKQRFVVKKT